MKKVTVEYYDQNEEFASFLPRSGPIVRSGDFFNDGKIWHQISLEASFDIQLEISPNRHSLVHCNRFFISSREIGREVGDRLPVTVFILLPLTNADPENSERYSKDEFIHIAWGKCSLLK